MSLIKLPLFTFQALWTKLWRDAFFPVPAASPLWTVASPSAPDTWATTGPRCRTSPRTWSPASAPRRPPRPTAPQRRRGSSCRQVSWVTQSLVAVMRQFPKSWHTLGFCNNINWFTDVCLCIFFLKLLYSCQLELSSATASSECHLKSVKGINLNVTQKRASKNRCDE